MLMSLTSSLRLTFAALPPAGARPSSKVASAIQPRSFAVVFSSIMFSIRPSISSLQCLRVLSSLSRRDSTPRGEDSRTHTEAYRSEMAPALIGGSQNGRAKLGLGDRDLLVGQDLVAAGGVPVHVSRGVPEHAHHRHALVGVRPDLQGSQCIEAAGRTRPPGIGPVDAVPDVEETRAYRRRQRREVLFGSFADIGRASCRERV